ncbi:MAG: hypothetical protein HC888_19260, partial [Candidatus Competibacteraceae bacterium]|nr:hypothetical protein [Candidatus Competibacteraceae bacterium]
MFASSMLAVTVASTALLGQFTAARIGDIDGFGWGTHTSGTKQYQAVQAGHRSSNTYGDYTTYSCPSIVNNDLRPINFDGLGLLGMGDFLPDLDKACVLDSTLSLSITRKVVAYDSAPTSASTPWTNWTTDDWDWRSADEVNQASSTRVCTGCTFITGTGSHFTDITLSESFDRSFPSPTYAFPTNPRTGENNSQDFQNQPRFVFEFRFAKTGITPASTKFYLNLLFGDYDVGVNTQLKFTAKGLNNSNVLTTYTAYSCLTKQDIHFEDGLVQGGTVELNQVFGADWYRMVRSYSATEYVIYLQVDWVDGTGVENNEPYTAFDFAEVALNSDSIKMRRVGSGYAYSTIQSAIDSIPAGERGWTIVVAPGTYAKFKLWGGKLVSILGRTSCGDVGTGPVIDAQGSGSAVTYSGSEELIQLSGFTIKNGSATLGAGIRGNGANVEIHNCIIEDNDATGVSGKGGGIAEIDGSIYACTIQNNTAVSGGGGLYNCGGTIENCTIEGNSAGSGGGIYNYGVSSTKIVDCMIAGNTATYGGGGMMNFDSSPRIERTEFWENIANRYGGGMANLGDQWSADSNPTVINCTFWKNEARYDGYFLSGYGGGMVNFTYAIPTVTNCT